MGKPSVLSFHYNIESDTNLCWSKDTSTKTYEEAIRRTDAVILPQGCNKTLYDLAQNNCRNVFPNYDAFFQFPGKIGQIHLFEKHKAAYPSTTTFENLNKFNRKEMYPSIHFPCVFKHSWGGEGNNVYLINSKEDLDQALDRVAFYESNKKFGFLLQEYIPTNGRSLRVTVIGNQYYPYWRVAAKTDDFYSNIRKGASIDKDLFPDLQQKALKDVDLFCKKTSINLAGFDFLFSTHEDDPQPLFLEINYFFRCKGLGGQDNYMKLLEASVRDWINTIK